MDAILGELSARSLGIPLADHVFRQRQPVGRYRVRRRAQRREQQVTPGRRAVDAGAELR